MGSAPAILEVVGQSVWRSVVAGLRPGDHGAGGRHALARPALARLAVCPLVARLGPPAPAPGAPGALEPVQPRRGAGRADRECRARDGRRRRAHDPGPRRRRCRPLAVNGFRAARRAGPHGTDAWRVIRDARIMRSRSLRSDGRPSHSGRPRRRSGSSASSRWRPGSGCAPGDCDAQRGPGRRSPIPASWSCWPAAVAGSACADRSASAWLRTRRARPSSVPGDRGSCCPKRS